MPARPLATSPAAPCGPRPAAPPAPSAAPGCSSAAWGSPTAGSGLGSGPGRVRALGLRAPGRGVLGETPGPPWPLPLPPTPALTLHSPSSLCDWRPRSLSTGSRPLLPRPLPETVIPYKGGRGDEPSPALLALLNVISVYPPPAPYRASARRNSAPPLCWGVRPEASGSRTGPHQYHFSFRTV